MLSGNRPWNYVHKPSEDRVYSFAKALGEKTTKGFGTLTHKKSCLGIFTNSQHKKNPCIPLTDRVEIPFRGFD